MRVAARGYRVSLGRTSQAYKACACPASRLKKDPRVSNRNTSGLRMGVAHMSEARSRSNNPPCAADSGQNRAVVFTPRGRGRLPVIGGTDIRLAIS